MKSYCYFVTESRNHFMFGGACLFLFMSRSKLLVIVNIGALSLTKDKTRKMFWKLS